MSAPSLRFDDKVVLVTGGSRGLGLATARKFQDAGATVVICARTPPAEGGTLEFVACDVRDPDAVTAMVAGIVERHGRLDVLVNNAGGSPEVDAAVASPRLSERVLQLNLLAPLYLSQAANRWMAQQQDGGAIVNIASVSAIRPSPGTAVYAAAKAGLIALTRSLAHEWGPKVRLNALTVGYVETEQTELTYGTTEQQGRIGNLLALRRLGTSDEIADAVLFLASPAAGFITGEALVADGGGERPGFLDILRDR